MDPRALVRPLEAPWQSVLDHVLGTRFGLTTRDVSKLAPKLEELSVAYNTAAAEGTRTRLPMEARIAFSFARDVPKGAAAVRELALTGTLERGRPLRVIDLGAGLGAMTWGLARAISAHGQRSAERASHAIDALLVDEDAQALEVASSIHREATASGVLPSGVDLSMRTKVSSLRGTLSEPRADVVFLGQVLSEIDPRAEPDERLETHLSIVERVVSSFVDDHGSLVIVEPALRDRTRHLHRLRDRLLESGERSHRPLTVFAPCLHARSCPALPVETEWCHEDQKVDLPSWLVPLARGAGLRYQGLTFSYLVLRRDGRTMARSAQVPGELRFRAISDVLATKGKSELFICDEQGRRVRIRQLDRDQPRAKGALSISDLGRGDVVRLTSGRAETSGSELGEVLLPQTPLDPVDERGRVRPNVTVEIDVNVYSE